MTATEIQRLHGMCKPAAIVLGACFAVGLGLPTKDLPLAPKSLVQVSTAARLVRRSSLEAESEGGGDRLDDARERHRGGRLGLNSTALSEDTVLALKSLGQRVDSGSLVRAGETTEDRREVHEHSGGGTPGVALQGAKINEFLVAWMKSMGTEDIFPWTDKFGVVPGDAEGKEAFGFAVMRQIIVSMHGIIKVDISDLDLNRCRRLQEFLLDSKLNAWDGAKEWFGIFSDTVAGAKDKHCKSAGGPGCSLLEAVEGALADSLYFVGLLHALAVPTDSGSARASAENTLDPLSLKCTDAGRNTLRCLLMDFNFMDIYGQFTTGCSGGAPSKDLLCNCFSNVAATVQGGGVKCAPLVRDFKLSTTSALKYTRKQMLAMNWDWDTFLSEMKAIPYEDETDKKNQVHFYPNVSVYTFNSGEEPRDISTEGVAKVAMSWIAMRQKDLSNPAILGRYIPNYQDCDKDVSITFLSNVLSGFEKFWGTFPAKSVVAWLERTHLKVKVFSEWLDSFQMEIRIMTTPCVSRIDRALDLGIGALQAAVTIQKLLDRQTGGADYSQVKWDFLAEWSSKPCDASNRNEMIEYASLIEEGLSGHEQAGADALKTFCAAKQCFSGAAPNTVCSCSKLLLQRLLKEEMSEAMDSCGQQMTSACILEKWGATRKEKHFEDKCTFPKEVVAEALGELLSMEVDKAKTEVGKLCPGAP